MITQNRQRARVTRSRIEGVHYAPAALIATWLTTRERQRVDLIGQQPEIRLRHHDALTSLHEDLTESTSSIALISTSLATDRHVAVLSSLVRMYPEIAFVGVIMDNSETSVLRGVHALGLAGVPMVVDSRPPNGGAVLRRILHPETGPRPFTRFALDSIADDLGFSRSSSDLASENGVPNSLRFFAAVFSQRHRSVREMALSLGISASTLMSRFFRAKLPCPKRYLLHARLAWAAHLGEQRTRTASEIAHRLDFSSPQSFGRTLRLCTGLSFTEFRGRTDGHSMLRSYRESLIIPYREILRRFEPLKPT